MITIQQIENIVNQYSAKPLSVKSRKGDHPFYRGLYIVMARKYSGATDTDITGLVGMHRAGIYHWEENLTGWFFTRKDLKWVYESVDREVREQANMLSGVEVLDHQAQEVIKSMLA